MTNDVTHLFMHIVAILKPYLGKWLFRSFALKKKKNLDFLNIELQELFIYSRYKSSSDKCFANIFSHFMPHGGFLRIKKLQPGG